MTTLHAGVHMLPINLLSEPPSTLLIRDINDQFISSLKEMLDNPTSDVRGVGAGGQGGNRPPTFLGGGA